MADDPVPDAPRARGGVAVLALTAAILAPAAAWGWGVPGCTNLPAYNRALGALQGMTSACDMSVEQARRVVADHDGPAARTPQALPRDPQTAPKRRVHHRRIRVRRS